MKIVIFSLAGSIFLVSLLVFNCASAQKWLKCKMDEDLYDYNKFLMSDKVRKPKLHPVPDLRDRYLKKSAPGQPLPPYPYPYAYPDMPPPYPGFYISYGPPPMYHNYNYNPKGLAQSKNDNNNDFFEQLRNVLLSNKSETTVAPK